MRSHKPSKDRLDSRAYLASRMLGGRDWIEPTRCGVGNESRNKRDGSRDIAFWWWGGEPLGFDAGDANLYRYVRNRPTVERDSTGLIPSPPRPEPPLQQMPVPPGFEDPELLRLRARLILKSIELCDRQTSFPRPNALQKELIETTKLQIRNLQNAIRERGKYIEEKNPNKKMEHLINLDSLKGREKQLDDRERELKKEINDG